MSCSSFVGHDEAKRALVLNAVDPRCGGVLFVGEKGCGKSTLARALRSILPAATPFIELPLNVTEDALLGSTAIEETLRTGNRVFQHGILSRAHGGVLFIDDVNLLSSEIASLVLEVQSRGENVVEREGMSLRHPASFILVATMYPGEGEVSAHLLDRFGMCAGFEHMDESASRIAIIKSALSAGNGDEDRALADAIAKARSILPHVSVRDRLLEYIADICLTYNVAGHRADISMLAAARSQAALHGKREVSREEIDLVAPLVLMHRRRELQPPPPPPPEEQEAPDETDRNQPPPDTKQDQQEDQPQDKDDNQQNDAPPLPQELLPLNEEVFSVGQPFRMKRLFFRKDRIERAASGRRTRTRARNRGGRYVKSVFRQNRSIAIDATLRAAAPYQGVRNRTSVVVIDEDDFRYKRKERKIGHLALFVVDGSGSMGAQKRMVAAKGAIQSLLIDCYQKRDLVSMIVFRKDHAEVVLQPTASVEHAARLLRNIPVGGKTPLGAGLLEAHRLLERVGRKRPETRFLLVLITDGRANQAMTAMTVMTPDEEIVRVSALLREQPGIDIIVVDTEEKGRFTTTDRAASIAAQLEADYYTIDDLKADMLTELVINKKESPVEL
ncbi:MAG TPA: VWA domain-containing protein [Dissulfurispiraceae bacterium]|nr:VWA domain-containing protein [Dissulfurispiraceae bacterium]